MFCKSSIDLIIKGFAFVFLIQEIRKDNLQ